MIRLPLSCPLSSGFVSLTTFTTQLFQEEQHLISAHTGTVTWNHRKMGHIYSQSPPGGPIAAT